MCKYDNKVRKNKSELHSDGTARNSFDEDPTDKKLKNEELAREHDRPTGIGWRKRNEGIKAKNKGIR